MVRAHPTSQAAAGSSGVRGPRLGWRPTAAIGQLVALRALEALHHLHPRLLLLLLPAASSSASSSASSAAASSTAASASPSAASTSSASSSAALPALRLPRYASSSAASSVCRRLFLGAGPGGSDSNPGTYLRPFASDDSACG